MNAIPRIEETSDGRRLGISENAVPKNKRDTCDERRFLKRAMNAVIYSDKHCTKNIQQSTNTKAESPRRLERLGRAKARAEIVQSY